MTNTTKIFVAALTGAAAGAITGVLLAPASGKETRKNITSKAKDMQDTLADLTEKSKQKLDEIRETAEKMRGNKEKTT